MGSCSALPQENVVQAILSFGNGKNLMTFIASGPGNVCHGLPRIKNNLKSLSGFHGFQFQLGFDKIKRTLDASQIEDLIRTFFSGHESLRGERIESIRRPDQKRVPDLF